MAGSPRVRVRRVGFRDGTDDELALLHAVEAPVEAERRPDRDPQPLDSFMAFARSLPSQFDDHAWLVEDGGAPVASGYCWSNAAGDARVMECDAFVLREHRRRGIGSLLLSNIVEETAKDERSILTWSTFDTVPAGESFANHVGARAARRNRTSELRLAEVDWTVVESWTCAEDARAAGYRLEVVDGVMPVHLRADAATFHHIMQTQPRDELDVGDVLIGEDDVEQLDRALVESGRERWTLFVRAADGTCVGGTELVFEPWRPTTAQQQNTGIDPAHRGRGLAKWVKAAMLERLRIERPDIESVTTGNAYSNAPMLAINDALGFVVTSSRTEWQLDVG
jgi:GNAT superfamily N-acetyltransferase